VKLNACGIMRCCILCILNKILSGNWNQGGWDRIQYSTNLVCRLSENVKLGQILTDVPWLSSS